ncbi:uncharacterized protein LOC129307823 isoform X2 [Prosopis cineraria]|uniref:uncharacterized protein LOC129307823 isoform X2 n=1 Tax=Prosopis cineraria TaxID=364024 RepID=UPI00240F3537|nr:uncharacterized protein LOC129307823 isoform X2 [Prosopis cineraria]
MGNLNVLILQKPGGSRRTEEEDQLPWLLHGYWFVVNRIRSVDFVYFTSMKLFVRVVFCRWRVCHPFGCVRSFSRALLCAIVYEVKVFNQDLHDMRILCP